MSELLLERRVSRPLGWWGMLMLVASEGTLFGCLFGTYFYLRFQASQWPPPGVPEPRIAAPLVLAGVLAVSVVPQLGALRAVRAGRAAAAVALLLAALLVQAGVFAYDVHDFERQLRTFTPQSGAYGSIYYVLLGADHGHVAVGLLLDLWLLAKLAGGLTPYRVRATQAIALYWVAVAALTLCVTGTLLSATV